MNITLISLPPLASENYVTSMNIFYSLVNKSLSTEIIIYLLGNLQLKCNQLKSNLHNEVLQTDKSVKKYYSNKYETPYHKYGGLLKLRDHQSH